MLRSVMPRHRLLPRACFTALLAFGVATGIACPGVGTGEPEAEPDVAPVDAGITPDAPYGYPRTDLVPRIGRADAVDIATWNIENFPANVDTPLVVAELIASMDLDLVAVQEIASVEAWEELDARLPDFDSRLSSHTYSDGNFQKLGILYRRDIISVDSFSLLFTGSGYAFPRPPIRASITVDDGDHTPFDFTLIAVHLKAGGGAENEERRTLAVEQLHRWMREQINGAGDNEIVVLGDFNQTIEGAVDREVLAEFFDNPDIYRFQTAGLAEQDVASFIPSDRLIDHIVTTAEFDDDLDGAFARIPRLDTQLLNFERSVSDHLPVVLPIPVLR